MKELKPEINVGSEVMVPRTGGGYTKGIVTAMSDKLAVVSFQIGKTYQGKKNPYREDDYATKVVKITDLQGGQ
ncbi:MAG: hypothetical protein PHN69_04730 [Candidatus Pacebacteria bacterium]|nr:hypothetical protein [Candidatus Paceibacterota bacterium]